MISERTIFEDIFKKSFGLLNLMTYQSSYSVLKFPTFLMKSWNHKQLHEVVEEEGVKLVIDDFINDKMSEILEEQVCECYFSRILPLHYFNSYKLFNWMFLSNISQIYSFVGANLGKYKISRGAQF